MDEGPQVSYSCSLNSCDSLTYAAQGFFTIYGNLFRRIAFEESQHSFESEYPEFGRSTWTWASTNKAAAARDFYNVWLSFSTVKGFAWKDRWNMAQAPDRKARRFVNVLCGGECWIIHILQRLMEQDNKKAREDARHEYNDAIRACILTLATSRCIYLRSSRVLSTSSGNEILVTKRI